MELISVTIPVFNEKTYLKRCLDSLQEFPKVFVIDGKYPLFDHPSPFSDDGSLDIIKNYDNVELLQCCEAEVVKRNLGLEKSKDYKWCLTMDADEYIKHDETNLKSLWDELNQMEEKGHFYGVKLYFRGIPTYWPKMKRYPSEIEYYHCHTMFRVKNDLIIMHPVPHVNIKNLAVVNDDIHRNDSLKWARRNYHSDLKRVEVPLRKLYHGKMIDTNKEPI